MKENTSLELTRIRVHIYGPRHDTRYNLDTLARLAGIQPGLVSRWDFSIRWRTAVNSDSGLTTARFTAFVRSNGCAGNSVSTSTARASSWNSCGELRNWNRRFPGSVANCERTCQR